MNHGTISGYSHYRCRCRACRDAINAYHTTRRAEFPHLKAAQLARGREYRRRKAARLKVARAALPPRAKKPLPHGTLSGYNYHGCRCKLCCAANTDYRRNERERLAAGLPKEAKPFPHGTDNGYTNLNCRCDACRAAHAARNRAQYARSKAALALAQESRVILSPLIV